MTPEVFAEWLRCQGYRVVRTLSSYWYDAGPCVYQAFPFHWLIQPEENELAQFLRQHKAVALRYSTPLDSPVGQVSYHAICSKPTYELDDLGQWARKNVRRGLRSCRVERIPFERLAEEGWSLQADTLERQRRCLNRDSVAWRNLCLAAADLAGFEAWGALVQGRLAASVITFQMDDCGYLLYQQCHRDLLRAHVNNALAFVVTRTMIRRPGINSIFYGLHSLDAPASVDEFKFRMGYAAKPVRQRVVFHSWLVPLINRASYAVMKWAVACRRGGPNLTKAEGMVRFYLEGKRPIQEQAVPEPLARPGISLAN